MTLPVTATIQLTIVIGAALAVCLLLRRRSAALRHALLAAAVLAGGAAPLLGWIVPSWSALATWNPAVPASVAAVIDTPPVAAVDLPLAAPAASPSPLPSFVQVATSIWLLGVLAALAGLLLAIVRLVRLTRRCTPIDSGVWHESATRAARACGLTRDVVLLQSEDASPLLTWGLLRPCIVLPAGAATWTRERRQLVLAHEMAHIQRRDWIIQLVMEIVRTVHWFNPLVWIAARRLRYESECACDDAVLAGGVGPTVYASHLLAVAREASGCRQTLASAPAVADPSTLERRVAAMLHRTRRRDPLTRRTGTLVLAATLALTVPVVAITAQPGAWQPVSSAESTFAALSMPPATATPVLPTPTEPSDAVITAEPSAEPVPPATPASSVAPAPSARAAAAPPARPAGGEAAAQPASTDVIGTVVDAHGVIPGARVVLRNAEGQEWRTVSDSNGRFRFLNVAPGPYVLVTSLPGFRTVTSNVDVVPGRTADPRITLPVGDVFEEVSVVCAGTLLQGALPTMLFDVRHDAAVSPATLVRISTSRPMSSLLQLQAAGSPQRPAPEPVRVGGNVVPPRKLSHVHPVHPFCRQPDVVSHATVIVEGRISADGRVDDIRDVTRAEAAAPAAFVDAAIEAVRQWTYTPVMLNGRPTSTDLRVWVFFSDERR